LVFTAGTAGPVAATMLTAMPLERIAREAVRIVHGTVVDVQAGRDRSGLPATWVTLEVARSLKGDATRRVTIKQYGAPTALSDGTVTHVTGLPGYTIGEEVVLFLRGESRLGFTSPVGFGQGKYRVSRRGGRSRVRRDAPEAGSRDLDEFLAAIRTLSGP
jgi:hypothetical protein